MQGSRVPIYSHYDWEMCGAPGTFMAKRGQKMQKYGRYVFFVWSSHSGGPEMTSMALSVVGNQHRH
jgi:hypothetical protein